MTDYREIPRLDSLKHSQRSIAQAAGSSRNTVEKVLRTARDKGVQWSVEDDIGSRELEEILFPGKYKNGCRYVEPDYRYIHRELAKPGVTMALLWEEYCRKCHECGETPYMSTQLGDKYRRWARVTKATMRIQHKPGDAIQVDWAGDTLAVYDPVTGKQSSAYLFVAVLPCSCYTCAEACEDMKTENWLTCHVHAFQYFGGVTRLLIPDNCKTATTVNTRYETVLNRSYQELAEYYGTAIVPARVRKPQDKSAVEASVRFAETWIITALRNRKFFSIREENEAIAKKLEHMPLAHQKYLTYNTDDFSRWAMSVGPMAEKVVQHFLNSGAAPEQGYKACASLTKLGERYGKERLENACGRIMAYSTMPSVRNISSLLKNGQDRPVKTAELDKPTVSNSYSITRGASCFRKGGEG